MPHGWSQLQRVGCSERSSTCLAYMTLRCKQSDAHRHQRSPANCMSSIGLRPQPLGRSHPILTDTGLEGLVACNGKYEFPRWWERLEGGGGGGKQLQMPRHCIQRSAGLMHLLLMHLHRPLFLPLLTSGASARACPPPPPPPPPRAGGGGVGSYRRQKKNPMFHMLTQSGGGECRTEHTHASFVASVAHFAQLLFVDRMRKPADKQRVVEIFQRAFGSSLLSERPARPSHVAVSPAEIQLGWAQLPRTVLTGLSLPAPLSFEGGRSAMSPGMTCFYVKAHRPTCLSYLAFA